MRYEFSVKVLDEKMSSNKTLYNVVVEYEMLRGLYYANQTQELHAACVEMAKKLNDLLHLILNKSTNNVAICRTYKGYVWILELDYLDDGDVYLAPDWPDLDELESEGVASLIGESIELMQLEAYLEYQDMDDFDREFEELTEDFDFIELVEMNEKEPKQQKEKRQKNEELEIKIEIVEPAKVEKEELALKGE